MNRSAPTKTSPSKARQRILDTAYELFSQRGIQAVGTEELIDSAHVAKATFYKYFPSKTDLVLAFMAQREDLWTKGWVEAEARKRGIDSETRLLAIFDLFDEWFHHDDFEGCSFINILLEFGSDDPLGRASTTHLENIRGVIQTLATEGGLRDPAEFALSWHILMKGSIIQAAEGDFQAARRASAMARNLIDQHR